jgi:hypothetical protein
LFKPEAAGTAGDKRKERREIQWLGREELLAIRGGLGFILPYLRAA